MIEVTDVIKECFFDNNYVIDFLYNEKFPDPCVGKKKKLFVSKYVFFEDTPFIISKEGILIEGLTCNKYKEKKYNLSVACMFHNKDFILKEWLDHYLDEGVEHFYLIDNGSSDNFYPILNEYREYITFYSDETKNQQGQLYNNYIRPHSTESTWLLTVSVDEFVYARDGNLLSYVKQLPDNVSRVILPRKMFGSSDCKEYPESPIISFVQRRDGLSYDFDYSAVKTLLRFCHVVNFLDIHAPYVSSGKTILSDSHSLGFSAMTPDVYENYLSREKDCILQLNCYPLNISLLSASKEFNKVEDKELYNKKYPRFTYGAKKEQRVKIPRTGRQIVVKESYNNLFGDKEFGSIKHLTLTLRDDIKVKIAEDTPFVLNLDSCPLPTLNIVYYINTLLNENYHTFLSAQLNNLKESGLLNRANLYVQIFGNELVKEEVLNIFPSAHVAILEKEDFGMSQLWNLRKTESYILYFHAKGMKRMPVYRPSYEKILFDLIVRDWRKNIYILRALESVNKLGMMARKNGSVKSDFFWVKSSYLLNKEEPLSEQDKFYYRNWMGNPSGDFTDVYNIHCVPPRVYNIGTAYEYSNNHFKESYLRFEKGEGRLNP